MTKERTTKGRMTARTILLAAACLVAAASGTRAKATLGPAAKATSDLRDGVVGSGNAPRALIEGALMHSAHQTPEAHFFTSPIACLSVCAPGKNGSVIGSGGNTLPPASCGS